MTGQHAGEIEPVKWSCPHCPWEQRAHPTYGWAEHDERSVEVHLSMLCPGLDSPRRRGPLMGEKDAIRGVLNYDPLAEAERVRGTSYKDDEDTMRLGLGLAMIHNANKESLLRKAADSYLNMPFADQLALFAELGFEEVYREAFTGSGGDETFVILWHNDGVLATCESYNGTRRNSAKVYYNYRHPDGYPGFHLTSSGGMRGDVWVGDHDAREGIRHNLDAMRAEGSFVAPWIERPFLWLLNYSESKGEYDYDAINEAKIARLPQHVRDAITPPGPSGAAR